MTKASPPTKAKRHLAVVPDEPTTLPAMTGAERSRLFRERKAAREGRQLGAVGRPAKHGPSGYNRGCKCDICTEANRVRCANYRANRRQAAS